MSPALHRPARTLYLSLAAIVFLLDQFSKAAVMQALALGETRRIVPGLFNLTHLRNRGAAFGLFADVESVVVLVFLIGFSLAALVLVLVLLWRGTASSLSGWGLGLILGGALGNLFDRLRSGSVVDFLDFHLGPYHWPAFNLADSAIVIGAAVLMVEVFYGRHHLPEEASNK
jgi:signal peptidase II